MQPCQNAPGEVTVASNEHEQGNLIEWLYFRQLETHATSTHLCRGDRTEHDCIQPSSPSSMTMRWASPLLIICRTTAANERTCTDGKYMSPSRYLETSVDSGVSQPASRTACPTNGQSSRKGWLCLGDGAFFMDGFGLVQIDMTIHCHRASREKVSDLDVILHSAHGCSDGPRNCGVCLLRAIACSASFHRYCHSHSMITTQITTQIMTESLRLRLLHGLHFLVMCIGATLPAQIVVGRPSGEICQGHAGILSVKASHHSLPRHCARSRNYRQDRKWGVTSQLFGANDHA